MTISTTDSNASLAVDNRPLDELFDNLASCSCPHEVLKVAKDTRAEVEYVAIRQLIELFIREDEGSENYEFIKEYFKNIPDRNIGFTEIYLEGVITHLSSRDAARRRLISLCDVLGEGSTN